MLWHNQDNDVTYYVCAKQQLATMPIIKIIFFIP